MKKTLFALAITIAAVCSCDNHQIIDDPTPSSSGVAISGFDAAVASQQTKSSPIEAIQYVTEESEDGFSATLEVMPIAAMSATKAPITGFGDITRDGLKDSGFYVDGYLDPAASAVFGGNKLFEAKKADWTANDDDCAHGVHTDGHWHFSSNREWVSGYDHYFWAYYPSVTFSSKSYEAGTFSYTAAGSDDLVIAHHKQYWPEGTDELHCLNFNHPLAAVCLNTKNFTYKAQQTQNGEYVDASADRWEVSTLAMLGKKSGSCDITNYDGDIDFSWTVNSDEVKSEICTEGNTKFVIPQSTGTVTIPVTIKDKLSGVTYDDTWTLPTSFSSGATVTEWEAGHYYKYTYKATIKGPYVDPDNPGSFDPGFSGMPWQAAAPVGTLNFSYIKDLTISWTNVPMCNNKFQEVYLIITPNEIGITPNAGKDNRPEITDQTGAPALVDGNGEIVLLKTTATNQGLVSIYPVSKDKGVILKWGATGGALHEVTGKEDATLGTGYDIQFKLNAQTLGLEGRQYIYLVYKGGNESPHMKWEIKDFTVTIDSRR